MDVSPETGPGSPSAAGPIGVVELRQGPATAAGRDGVARTLEVGAAVYLNDVLRTEEGSALVIRLVDGRRVDLGWNDELVLDREVFDPGTLRDADGVAAQVEAAQRAILAGQDPTQVLPPPAAGLAPGAATPSSEGGHSFVVLDLTGQRVTPESGFETEGLQLTFPLIVRDPLLAGEQPELPPPLSVPPELLPELPTVAISDGVPAPQAENAEGSAITFTVTLSGPAEAGVTVDYATVNGSAVSGMDFVGQAGAVTFTPGETEKTITVQLVDDDVIEPRPETFTVDLSNAALQDGAPVAISDASGVGTIVDGSQPTVAISDGVPAPQAENAEGGAVTFTVALSGAADAAITVDYATVNGSAISGMDFVGQAGSVTFSPGETEKTITVQLVDDDVIEPRPETFTVDLSHAALQDGAPVAITDASGTGTIVDSAPSATIPGDGGLASTAGPEVTSGISASDPLVGGVAHAILVGGAAPDLPSGGDGHGADQIVQSPGPHSSDPASPPLDTVHDTVQDPGGHSGEVLRIADVLGGTDTIAGLDGTAALASGSAASTILSSGAAEALMLAGTSFAQLNDINLASSSPFP